MVVGLSERSGGRPEEAVRRSHASLVDSLYEADAGTCERIRLCARYLFRISSDANFEVNKSREQCVLLGCGLFLGNKIISNEQIPFSLCYS